MHALTSRLRDLRIGVRLAAVFALCGILIGAAWGLEFHAEGNSRAAADELDRVRAGQQIGDDLLISINDITGWQGLYVADAAAFGIDKGLSDHDYNIAGFAKSRAGIEKMFATMDRSMLTSQESGIIAEVEDNFQQFFDQDAELRHALESKGLSALPDVMRSINGGAAGAAWSDTYDAVSRFHELIDKRVAALTDQQESDLSRGRRDVVIALALSVIVTIALLVLVTRSVTTPLRSMVEQLRLAATGRLDVRSGLRRRDEVGQMSEALDQTLGALADSLQQLDTNAQALAASSESLSSVSVQLTGTAAESAGRTQEVSSTAERVSGNVQTLAAGTEEMSASIREIARNAADAAAVAGRAVAAAEATSATVARLGESSSEVGNVVKVINAIAEQTNLLALNATIEAARAGEAGKGFAVVAGEVKELARETSQATEDISRRIEAIQADTGDAVSAIAEISAVIAQISDSQTTIASAVEEQTATTNEMSRNVAEAASGSAEIAVGVTDVAQAAGENTAAASSTSQAAEELARLAVEMRELVGRFSY